MSKEQPEWAKKLEDLGKKVEEKFDRSSRLRSNDKENKPKYERKGDFIGNIFGSFLGLVIVTYAPKYFPDFFTSSYGSLLSVMTAIIWLQIFCYVLLVIFSPKWFYYLTQSAVNFLAVISMTSMLAIFPFNIPYGLDFIVRFGLTIATVIVGIVMIFQAFLGVISLIKVVAEI